MKLVKMFAIVVAVVGVGSLIFVHFDKQSPSSSSVDSTSCPITDSSCCDTSSVCLDSLQSDTTK